jgi:hypothetical protein
VSTIDDIIKKDTPLTQKEKAILSQAQKEIEKKEANKTWSTIGKVGFGFLLLIPIMIILLFFKKLFF